MTIEILNKNLDSDWESDLIYLTIDPKQIGGRKISIKRLSIIWEEVTGDFDGTLEFLLNDLNDVTTKAAEITINSDENKNDATTFLMNDNYDKLKIRFTKNGIMGGNIKIIATY